MFPLTGGLRASPGEWENPHNVLWEGKIRNEKSKPRIWLMKFIEKDIIFLTKKAIIYSVKWEASQQILITVHPSRLVEFACTLICIYISSSINSLYSRNKCIRNASLGNMKAHKQLWGLAGQSQHMLHSLHTSSTG